MGYNPSYKWINPTYPIYNWGYNPLTKWDEPPSVYSHQDRSWWSLSTRSEIMATVEKGIGTQHDPFYIGESWAR